MKEDRRHGRMEARKRRAGEDKQGKHA